MAKLLKLRRGTTTQHSSFTGAEGEVTVDTDKETLVVHDGSTAGGHPVAAEDMANVSSSAIAGRLSNDSLATSKLAAGALPSDVTVASANLVDGTIVNADVNASAAIAGTKISPNFGSQAISSGDLTITSAAPFVSFVDSDHNSDFNIQINGGALNFNDTTNSATRMSIASDGTVDVNGNLDCNSGLDVTGAITSTGKVEAGDDVEVVVSSGDAFILTKGGVNQGHLVKKSDNTTVAGLTNGGAVSGGVNDAAVSAPAGDLKLLAGGNNVNNNLIVDVTSSGIDVKGNLEVTSGLPKISLIDSDNNSDYDVKNHNGVFKITDSTNGSDRMAIVSNGATSFYSSVNLDAGVAITGNASITGDITSSSSNSITGFDAITLVANTPVLNFTESDGNPDYRISVSGGVWRVEDVTNGYATRLAVNTDGHVDVNGNLDVGAGLDVTGNITVSGTVDGRDVASDGSKLDGIESGATADQTASEIASALNGQNVYVGANNIGYDSNDYIAWQNNSHLNFFINGSNEFRMEADGDFHADGDVIAQSTTTASDKRLKENIEVIPNALEKVQALNGVSFDWKKTGERSAGVIAQEVQGVLPEAVKEVTPVKGGDSHLTVNYHALTSILIESIKELKAEIEELKGGK